MGSAAPPRCAHWAQTRSARSSCDGFARPTSEFNSGIYQAAWNTKDLLNKAYGSTFIGHWHQQQLTQELRLGLLGLDPKLTSSKRFEQSLSLLAEGSDQRRQARAAIIDLFTEYLARHGDRSASDWRLALEQLVLTQGEASLPQQESEMQSRASSSTLPMPPRSLQNEARQSLSLLTRELELARDVSALHARHAASPTQQSEIGSRLVLQSYGKLS